MRSISLMKVRKEPMEMGDKVEVTVKKQMMKQMCRQTVEGKSFIIKSMGTGRAVQPMVQPPPDTFQHTLQVMDSINQNRTQFKFDPNAIQQTSNAISKVFQKLHQVTILEKKLLTTKHKMTTRQELYLKYKGNLANDEEKDKDNGSESEKEYDSDCECDLCVEDEVWDYHPDFPQTNSTPLEELFQFRCFYFPHHQQPVNFQKIFRTIWCLKKYSPATHFAQNHTSSLRFNQLYRFHNLKQDKFKYQADQIQKEQDQEQENKLRFLNYFEQQLNKTQIQQNLLYEGQYQAQLELYKLKSINKQKFCLKKDDNKENIEQTQAKNKIKQPSVTINNNMKKYLAYGKQISHQKIRVTNFTNLVTNQHNTFAQPRNNIFNSIRI